MTGAPLFLFLLLSLFLAPCRSQAEPVDLPSGVWLASGAARTFGPGNLYEEIDGEAEAFLPYGFRELTVQAVSGTRKDAAVFRIERFRHASQRDAFGIYSRHRFFDQETTDLGGAEAIVSDASLDFFKGDSFVRIRASSPGTPRGELLVLGKAVAAVLPGDSGIPAEAKALYLIGATPGSVVLQKQAILGQERLAPGFEALMRRGGDVELALFMCDKAFANGTARTPEDLLSGLQGVKTGDDGIGRADWPRRTAWFKASGERLVGVAGKGLSKETALPILDELARVAKTLP